MRRWIGTIIFYFTKSKGDKTLKEIIRHNFKKKSCFHVLFIQDKFVITDCLEVIKILFSSKNNRKINRTLPCRKLLCKWNLWLRKYGTCWVMKAREICPTSSSFPQHLLPLSAARQTRQTFSKSQHGCYYHTFQSMSGMAILDHVLPVQF